MDQTKKEKQKISLRIQAALQRQQLCSRAMELMIEFEFEWRCSMANCISIHVYIRSLIIINSNIVEQVFCLQPVPPLHGGIIHVVGWEHLSCFSNTRLTHVRLHAACHHIQYPLGLKWKSYFCCCCVIFCKRKHDSRNWCKFNLSKQFADWFLWYIK